MTIVKRTTLAAFIVAASLLLSACATASGERGRYSGTLILEGDHTFEAGQTLAGALAILDGTVTLGPGSKVEGPILLFGGNLAVRGVVAGDIIAIGGELSVGAEAAIDGNLRLGDSQVKIAPEARIGGQVLSGAAAGVRMQDLFPRRSMKNELLWLLPKSLLFALFAFLAVRYLPRPVQRISQAASQHPLISAAMGMLYALILPVLLVVMAYTLILIPVTLLGAGLGIFVIRCGLIGIGVKLGRLMADWSGRRLSPAFEAALGAFGLNVLLTLITLVPLVGPLIEILVNLVALGAVMLTRFGIRPYSPPYEWEKSSLQDAG